MRRRRGEGGRIGPLTRLQSRSRSCSLKTTKSSRERCPSRRGPLPLPYLAKSCELMGLEAWARRLVEAEASGPSQHQRVERWPGSSLASRSAAELELRMQRAVAAREQRRTWLGCCCGLTRACRRMGLTCDLAERGRRVRLCEKTDIVRLWRLRIHGEQELRRTHQLQAT